MIFDDVLLDDLDEELCEKDINSTIASKIDLCHTKVSKQGLKNGGIKK
jgi:hypothetical protein